jgi:general secretion pathway protein H
MIEARGRAAGAHRQAGFTLLEMIIVVAVIGLALGLALTRGPVRSPKVEMQAAVNTVTQGLRLARSRAIATNRPVRFAVVAPLHAFRTDADTPVTLAPSINIAMLQAAEEVGKLPVIRFDGDGSATGGRIEVAGGQWATQIDVDWLTGRITVAQVR